MSKANGILGRLRRVGGRASDVRPLSLAAALLLAACSRQAPQPPGGTGGLRLVSTAPNLTECVYAVGAGEALVGRTETCDYPPDVRGVPVVGGFGTPWLEPLLSVRPSHVLETALADPDIAKRLTGLGVSVIHIPCSRLDEVPVAIRQIGMLTGCRAEGERVADRLLSGIASAREEAAGRADHPRAFLLLDSAALITAGSPAFISELLELAGATNVGAGPAPYYRFSLEWLLRQNPDIIICCFDVRTRDPSSLFAKQTGWDALNAVRQRRVYAVANLDTVCRPGPRLLEGLAELKRVFALDARRRSETRTGE